jgi:hypothetical protein
MKKQIITLAAALALAVSGYGQITIVNSGAGAGQVNLGAAYLQSFDSLASTGTSNTWSDNSTIAGWYSSRVVYIGDSGTSTTGGLHSYGSDSDRALGSIASGTTTTVYFGTQFVNAIGSTIDTVTVSYDGEQWRRGGNTPQRPETLSFSDQIFSAGAGSLTAATGWTTITSLDFVTPNASDTAASALDGNLLANRVSGIAASITGISFQNTQELWIRWADADNTGTDHGIAIDNVSVTAIPEPSTYALIMGVLTLGFIVARRRQKA